MESKKFDTVKFRDSVRSILDVGITETTLLDFFKEAKSFDEEYRTVLGKGYTNKSVDSIMRDLIKKSFDDFEKEMEEKEAL